LLSPPEVVLGKLSTVNETVAAGKSIAIDLPPGPAAVCQLEFKLNTDNPAELEHMLRTAILQVRFDNEDTIWCPAGDFFGSGLGVNTLQSWYRSVRLDGKMVCRWVMPYEKSARMTIANVGSTSLNVSLRATTGPWNWDDRSMHFHGAWHYEDELKTPPARDWNYIHIEGRGVYVGDTLALFNPVATWYGEGDEKIRVDGEAFPSHLGTGTEDYYDFSFAPQGLMQTPFANQVRVDQPMTQGNNVLTRSRNLDGIPFLTSLNLDFELISWRPTKLIYAATTYWYAFPGASANVVPQPLAAASPIPTLADAIAASSPQNRPGVIEFEKLKVLSKSGDFSVAEQSMEPFGGERWSGGAQLLIAPKVVGDFVEIQIPAPDTVPRRLVLYPTQGPDYGAVRFSVNGQRVASEFDGYAKTVQPAPAVDLGIFSPQNGTFTIRLEVIGANPSATGAKYLCGLDCIVLKTP
jgi:hypothetical protein